MAYIFSITFSVHIIHFFIFFAISFVEGVKHAKLVDKCERLFENIMKNRTLFLILKNILAGSS